MLGPFLGVSEQAGTVFGILNRCLAARAGARNRPDRDFPIAHADEDFGARAGERESRKVEMVEER